MHTSIVRRALLLAALLPGLASAQAPTRELWSDPKSSDGAPPMRVRVADAPSGAVVLRAVDAPSALVAPVMPRLPLAPGPKPYVTLLCRFPDFPNVLPGTREQFERIMASPEFPSVNHYWTEVSDGRITLDGSKVYGWYTLPHDMSHYVSPSGYGVNFGALDQDCTAAADADVKFTDFHGVNFVVNTNLDGRLYAGGFTTTLDGERRSWHSTYLDGAVTDNVGLTAHEIGHTFGLSHTSSGGGSDYDSRWDVMSASGWYRDPRAPAVLLPAHTMAYQKYYLGIIPTERRALIGPGTTTLRLERHARPAANGDPLMAVIPVPGSRGGEYFLLEVRGGPGSGYDAGHPEAGVVVHAFGNFRGVTVLDADGNGDPNDAGAMLVAGESWLDRITGIRVRVDARDGSAFRLTVTVPDAGAVEIDPAARRRAVAFGDAALHADSARVSFSGSAPATSPWRATTRSSRLTITNPSGTGAATLRWTTTATELAPGTYLDSIVVVAPGLADSIAVVRDTLVVAAPATLRVGLSTASWRDSVVAGRTGLVHAASVTPTGPEAASATWTATKRAPWIELLPTTDFFNPYPRLVWRHVATDLAVGTYVDTIVVTLSNGATARLVDSLRVLPPLAIGLSRPSGRRRTSQGASQVVDSVFVTLDGAWAANALLMFGGTIGTPSYLRAQPRLVPGSGWLVLRRNAAIAAGTYVNRLRVYPAADPAAFVEYVDTLEVDAAPITLRVSAASRRDTVVAGMFASVDSVRVEPQGPDASNRKWDSSANATNTIFLYRNGTYGGGTGAAWLVWQRNVAAHRTDGAHVLRAPGTYVDTITVRFDLGVYPEAHIIDTLVVLGPPTLSVAAPSRRATTMVGRGTTSRDSVAVAVSGFGVENGAWSATNRASWSTLGTPSGTGAGMLRWTRDAAGLVAGLYVDTITIASPGVAGSPFQLLDSLRVWPALAIATPAERPAAVMGADYADTIRAEGGIGAVALAMVQGALPAGLAFDATTGAIRGVPEARGASAFTVRAQSGEFTVEREFRVTVGTPAITATAILDRLLGDGALDADRLRYLDLLGNRNGRLDVGDVRAWLATTAQAASDPATRELRAMTASMHTADPKGNP